MRTTPSGEAPNTLTASVVTFCQELRGAGLAISPTEAIDAIRALRHVELTDRSQFRAALAASIVKHPRDQAIFDQLFATHFALRRAYPRDVGGPEDTEEPELPAGEGAGSDIEGVEREIPSDAVLRALLDALRTGDDRALRELASAAVTAHGGLNQDREAGEKYYMYRVLHQLELSRVLQQAMQRALEDLDGIEAHVARQELSAHVETLRQAITDEIRRQMVELRGAVHARDALRPGIVEEVDFTDATRSDIEAMRELVRPLARRLATRIAAKRRRHARGRLDVRRTMRRSLSTGGVPLDPAFRRPRVTRPDVFLVGDLSGSMAEFATFTITLLHAMTEEIGRLRSFAFVDGVDEVTEWFVGDAPELSVRNLLARSEVIADDGHSDYGAVLRRFLDQYGDQVTSRTTVIIVGDARSNHRDAGVDLLKRLHRRARRVYWLNPESRADWDTSDSVMGQLAVGCDAVFEVRNLRQLENAVLAIL